MNNLRLLLRSVRFDKLLLILLISLILGLIVDWFHTDTRLIFSRPLPTFNTIRSS